MAEKTKGKSSAKKPVEKKKNEIKKPVVKKTTTKKPTQKKTTTKKETKTIQKTKKAPAKKTPVKKTEVKKEEKPKAKPKAKKEDEKPEEKVEEEVEEEKVEEYKAKKKPELSKELKEKLVTRKQIKKRKPEFLREEWFRYKRISKSWRRPDGISSKMRMNLKYRPNKVRVGFRGPKDARGLHSSGFEEVIVFNVNDLMNINPKTQAARIGGSVGTKKRMEIEKKAGELEVRILNM
jgi:large subunit ribosomal protein L32e